MRWDISIPQYAAGGFDGDGVRDYLARAEQLGLSGAWVMESILSSTPMIAALEMLSYAAASTEHIRLGVAVLVTSTHEPLQLSHQVASLDQLSHGRLDLGVAPGARSPALSAFGVDPASFIARFTEGLELMKAAWSDEPTLTHHGRFHDVDGLAFATKPVQRPHPPLWFGASAPKALARAVRLGDGFLGGGSATTAEFAEQVQVIRREMAVQGRAEFAIAKRVYLMIDDDVRRARRLALEGLRRTYGQWSGVEHLPVVGTPADVVRGLRDVIDAGAQTIVLNPVGADVPANRQQLERLAAQVLPALN